MRTTSVISTVHYPAAEATTTGGPVASFFSRLMAGWRAGRADQIPLDHLANMDSAVLRDIGVESDEIARIHAGQIVTPRTWQR